MKAIILAAGMGTRLRPLTDHVPKCMVKARGRALIDWQIDTLRSCGISLRNICVVGGYLVETLHAHFQGTDVCVLENKAYAHTNMVCSLLCARTMLEQEKDVIVSYGDIVYGRSVLERLLQSTADASVVVDEGWLSYWQARSENPLEDAETLKIGVDGCLVEIGQKTRNIRDIEAQYIGLMRFRNEGLEALLRTADEARRRSAQGFSLWRTKRCYDKMYLTDLLQGMIDSGERLGAVRVDRGWFEVDCKEDLRLLEFGWQRL